MRRECILKEGEEVSLREAASHIRNYNVRMLWLFLWTMLVLAFSICVLACVKHSSSIGISTQRPHLKESLQHIILTGLK